MFETYFPKQDEVEKKWFEVDASGKTLGRLASEIAQILRGKHKASFTPHMDYGDFVIVTNADQVEIEEEKKNKKTYFVHTGYLGNEKEIGYREMQRKHPEEIIRRAVKGMLPSNKLGNKMLNNLKVYADSEHPHQAQQPEPLNIET